MSDELFRVVLPNGKRTKPLSRAKIIAAHRAGKSPHGAKVAADDQLIPIELFCEPPVETAPAEITAVDIRPVPATPRPAKRWPLLLAAGCPLLIAVVAFAIWPREPATESPPVTVTPALATPPEPPEQEPADLPVKQPSKQQARMGHLVSLMNTALNNDPPVVLAGFSDSGNVGFADFGDTQIEVTFSDDALVTKIRVATPTLLLHDASDDVRDPAIASHVDAVRVSCPTMVVGVGSTANTAQAMIAWFDANELPLVIAGSDARLFEDDICAFFASHENDSGERYRLAILTTEASESLKEAARESAAASRKKAEADANDCTSWTAIQEAMKGIEGYDMQPPITKSLAGRIAIGDSMLDVAKRLSIWGSETSAVEGMCSVEWTDDETNRTILLTFEDGKVSQKLSM